MKQNLKRCLSLALSAVLCLSLVPASAIPARAAADGSVSISEKTFPDPVFRDYVQTLPGAEDGVFTAEELGKIDKMFYSAYEQPGEKKIKDLTGLHHFYALTSINFNNGLEMESLNLFSNPNLELVQCASNGLKHLDVSHNPKLQAVQCGWNSLGELDVSHNPELVQLECADNNLTRLDLRHNPKLDTLKCQKNQLKELNLVMQSELYHLECQENELTRLDLSRTNVYDINADFGSKDMELVLPPSNGFDLYIAKVTPTDPVGCTVRYEYVSINDGVDVATFRCNGHTTTLKRSGVEQGLAIDEKNFPDPAFRAYVQTLLGSEDGVFTDEELARITEIDCHGEEELPDFNDPRYIKSLKGIELFTNLEKLDCSVNPNLSELDVSVYPNLKHLNINTTIIDDLDLSHSPQLEYLNIGQSRVAKLDVSHNPKLINLSSVFNYYLPADGVDVSHNPELEALDLGYTSIETLDVSHNPKLVYVSVSSSRIKELDLTGCPELLQLSASDMPFLERVDLTGCPKLRSLMLTYAPKLNEIDISRNKQLGDIFYEFEDTLILPREGIRASLLYGEDKHGFVGCHVTDDGMLVFDEGVNEATYKYTATHWVTNPETQGQMPEYREETQHLKRWPGQTITTPEGVTAEVVTDELGRVTADIQVPATVEKTSLTIPVENVTNGTVAVMLHEDGTEEVIRTCLPVEGGVKVAVTGNVKVKLVDRTRSFDDVPADQWFVPYVQFSTARGLFSGISPTEFGPDIPMTRSMLAVVLRSMDDDKNPGKKVDFPDVPAHEWYADAVTWAANRKIVSGYPDGRFGPEDPITREQLALMLYNYAGKPAVKIEELTFADSAAVSPYARTAINWAVQNGILSGVGGNMLSPQGLATRAVVSTMLMRFVGVLL